MLLLLLGTTYDMYFIQYVSNARQHQSLDPCRTPCKVSHSIPCFEETDGSEFGPKQADLHMLQTGEGLPIRRPELRSESVTEETIQLMKRLGNDEC
jgi:hypothetical protein